MKISIFVSAIFRLFDLGSITSFFATSHGKSPCDGIGATLKRIIDKKTLQNKLNSPIINAKTFVKYFEGNPVKIEVKYHEKSAVQETIDFVKIRKEKSITVDETRTFHFFEPYDGHSVLVKTHSQSYVSEIISFYDIFIK